MNTVQEEYTSNVDMSNVHKDIKKYTENYENSNEYIEKPKSELSSNHENTTLKSIEKKLEGLKIKNDLIINKVQMIDDNNKLSNDEIITVEAEMDKIQNEIENMHDVKITSEIENASYFNAIVDKMLDIDSHIDQFIVVANDLKFAVEEAYENKEIITELMEVSEYLRAQYFKQVIENQRHFTEQLSKHVSEIDRLKVYADVKVKEVDTLERRANDQQFCIDSYEKSMENITRKLSNFLLYVKQLQNENDQLALPDENKKFFLSLSVQLEEMDDLLRTTKMYGF